MSPRKAVIVGTGGHAQVLFATYQVQPPGDIELVGWLEQSGYDGADTLHGLPVFTESPKQIQAMLSEGITHFYFGVGMVSSNPKRQLVFDALCRQGLAPLSLIHPSAVISPYAVIEEGCFVGAQCVVQPFAHLGATCILNSGALVEHHVQVGQNSHVAPRAVLCGDVRVGRDVMIGASAMVIQGLEIVSGVTVGAGSVVIDDLLQPGTVAGNPARYVKLKESVGR